MHTLKGPARKVAAIIPALDEEDAIGTVVRELRALRREDGSPWLDEVVVADNGSKDATAARAQEAGASVVSAAVRGDGSGCLAGIAHLAARAGGAPEVVAFVDGDGSNVVEELPLLMAPLDRGEAALVIGARPEKAEPGSLTIPQRFGNILATQMLNALYQVQHSDLGPFRAVTWSALTALGMEDTNYGWTVEMQVKAAKKNFPVTEVSVSNKSRIAGKSKVAGTVRGVAGAGYKIIYTILKYR